MGTKAKHPFWLDGSHDAESVEACKYHPRHNWWTFALGEVLESPSDPDEKMTICRGCFVPRCGTTEDKDRCLLPRHHTQDHLTESRESLPVGV